jgi:hypothetical protein
MTTTKNLTRQDRMEIAIAVFVLAAVAMAAALGVRVLVADEDACTMIAPHADEGPSAILQGADYDDGVWYDADGAVIGYTLAEDSEVWSEASCL